MKSDPRLRVGLVFDDTLDSNDGVAQYVKTLGAWLTDQGHHVSYLVGETKLTSWHGARVYSLSKNIKVNFNGNKLSMPLPTSPSHLKHVITDEEFDVIHVMVPYSPFMAAKVIKSAPKNVPVIGTFHIFPSGWLSKLGSSLLRVMLSRTLRRFNQIVSVSPVAADFAAKAYHVQSKVVPNTIDIKKFIVAPPKAKLTKTIVFLGRLVDRKGAGFLIKAFARLPVDNTRLVIAGDGPQRRDLEALTAKLKIQSKVEFLGYIDEADKPGLLANADIACFPSLYGESFGIVLIEAMAAGSRVVLAGDNPGYRSVLGKQPKLLINPKQIQAFSSRLQELLTNHKEIKRLSKWQHETVGQYDIETVGKEIVCIYSGQIARLDKKSNNKAHG
jgi:phosphatidylinositol alpha-mannosyltransferase